MVFFQDAEVLVPQFGHPHFVNQGRDVEVTPRLGWDYSNSSTNPGPIFESECIIYADRDASVFAASSFILLFMS